MSEPIPGDVVGEKYAIEAVLGRGGMGAVYRARHRVTGRTVALKWLLEDDEGRRARFLREAKAMGRLSHPNVVGVLDVGDHEGAIFLVMDYVEGESLRDHVADRALDPPEAVALLLPAFAGVAAAHQAGILHRDLKPENLFVCLDVDGTAFDTKVLDFGVAKSMATDGAPQASLTHSGAVVGTPRYMAPEQLGEEATLDARCDVYALGLITFELLAGQLPYRSKSLNALFLEILTADFPLVTAIRPELPEELAQVVHKALSREPRDRYESVAAFAQALEPFGDGERFSAPRLVHTPEGAKTGEAFRRSTDSKQSARVVDERLTRLARPQAREDAPDPEAETVAAPSDDAVAARRSAGRSRTGWIVGAIMLLGAAAIAIAVIVSSEDDEVAPRVTPAPIVTPADPVEPEARPEEGIEAEVEPAPVPRDEPRAASSLATPPADPARADPTPVAPPPRRSRGRRLAAPPTATPSTDGPGRDSVSPRGRAGAISRDQF